MYWKGACKLQKLRVNVVLILWKFCKCWLDKRYGIRGKHMQEMFKCWTWRSQEKSTRDCMGITLLELEETSMTFTCKDVLLSW